MCKLIIQGDYTESPRIALKSTAGDRRVPPRVGAAASCGEAAGMASGAAGTTTPPMQGVGVLDLRHESSVGLVGPGFL